MRALDPAAGPVERFACELRTLRAVVGEPAFWKMARRCTVSKSALAAAVAGYQLPSDRVTRDFVRVCGGDWPWWSARLARARAELEAATGACLGGGSQHTMVTTALLPARRMPLVRATIRSDLAVRAIPPPSLPAHRAGYRSDSSRRRAGLGGVYRRHPALVLASVGVVVLAGVAAAVSPFVAPTPAPLHPTPSAPRTLAAKPRAVPPADAPPRVRPSPPHTTSRFTPVTPVFAPPVAIDLVRVVHGGGEGDSHVTAQPLYLSAKQLGQLNATKLGEPAHQAWFTAHGAVDLDLTAVQIIVEGNRNHKVRIVDLQPVATCSAPLTGTLFLSPSAGSDGTTQLFVELDSPRRTLRYAVFDHHGVATSGQDFFGSYTVSLARGEQQVFELVASTKKRYCTFTLNMSVLDGGQLIVEHISDDGRPFAVSATVSGHTTGATSTYGVYSRYSVLYLGGVLSASGWERVDPNTYAP